MKTIIFSVHGFDKPFLEKAAQGKHELVFSEQQLNEDTVFLAKGCEAVVIFTSDSATATVLEKLSSYGIKYLALRTVGSDHVDLSRSETLGIKVANVPAYSPYAIAEHAVALLLALNRKIILGQQLMKKGDFRLDALLGFDLHGKTVGIIGTGKIGGAFANIMHGFGCNLLGYDIEANEQLEAETGISYGSLEDLYKYSDIISLNCPLNKNTKNLFNKKAFSLMKKGVFLINTARGGIINTKDLIDALDNGIVAAAGLDVYENENPIFFHDHSGKKITDQLFQKLSSYPNVLISGHQAFLTTEALKEIADTTIFNLDSWEQKGTSKNELIAMK